jgi:hypothetical protein
MMTDCIKQGGADVDEVIGHHEPSMSAAWRDFSTAPRDREIFATLDKGPNAPLRTSGQRLKWSNQHQDWMQFVGGHWYSPPFFQPTHWAEIPASGARPEPMFIEGGD